MPQEHTPGIGPAGARRRHQHRFTARQSGVRIRPGLQQTIDDAGVTAGRRQRERRDAEAIGGGEG